MRARPYLALLLAIPVVAGSGCKSKPDPTQTTTIGPFRDVPQWRESNKEGVLLKCYLLGQESNNPVRVCGDGIPSPDNKYYLMNAVSPVEGKFSDEGKPLAPGWYLLRDPGSKKVDAWALGRLGEHQWLGSGKALLAVDTDPQHTTHVRVIDPVGRNDRTFDVPLSESEGFVFVVAPSDAAVLLIQKVGVKLAILLRDPLTNPYIETLSVPDGKGLGTKKLWRRGNEARSQPGGLYKIDATIASNIDWKGQDPQYEGSPLGPFESMDERRLHKK